MISLPVRDSSLHRPLQTKADLHPFFTAAGIRHLVHLLVPPFVIPTPHHTSRRRTTTLARRHSAPHTTAHRDRSGIACLAFIHPIDRLFRL